MGYIKSDLFYIVPVFGWMKLVLVAYVEQNYQLVLLGFGCLLGIIILVYALFINYKGNFYEQALQDALDLSRRMNFPAYTNEEGVNSLIEEIKKLNNDLNIPKSFKEAGIDEQEFLAKVDILADRAFEDQCTTANPRLPLVSELKQILLDSYYGN